MTALVNSHVFRIFMILVGLAMAPISAHLIDITWMGGSLEPTFERITFYAWINLMTTTSIPFIALTLWTYVLPFVPNIGHEKPHQRAHAIAVIVSFLFDIALVFWSHRSIWMSTDPSSAARFVMAPFATLSVQVVLYMVVFSVVFRVGKL